jgi:hypothetical protein
MKNNKPRTIDEFFIEKYNKLEEENQELKRKIEKLEFLNIDIANAEQVANEKYYELVNRLKEDYRIALQKCSSLNGITYYISIDGSWIWKNTQKEKYEYYKNVFDLKEEGEEYNEQRCSENNQA